MLARVKWLTVSDPDCEELSRRVRGQTIPARQVGTARIVLLAAEGRPAAEIAGLVGCHSTVQGVESSGAETKVTNLDIINL